MVVKTEKSEKPHARSWLIETFENFSFELLNLDKSETIEKLKTMIKIRLHRLKGELVYV